MTARPAQEKESPPPTRQNPVLREYFEKRYVDIFSPQPARSDFPNRHFMEQYIDRQIDYFLTELREKLSRLQARREEMEKARAQLHKGRHAAGFKEAVTELADSVEDLRKMLAFILAEMKSEGDFKAAVAADAAGTGFEKEIRFVEEQLERAREAINQYFFEPVNTVRVEELKGENMLTFLYRAREMCRKIRDQL